MSASTTGRCLNEEFVSGEMVGGGTDDEILSKLDRIVEKKMYGFRGLLTMKYSHPGLMRSKTYKTYCHGYEHSRFHGARDLFFEKGLPAGSAHEFGLLMTYQ